MATKLKNLIRFETLTERQKSVFLAVLLIQESIFVTFAHIFSRYADYFNEPEREYLRKSCMRKAAALMIAAVLLGVFFWRCCAAYLKQHPPGKVQTARKADRIRTEILVLAWLIAAGIWFQILFDLYPSGTGNFLGMEGIYQGCTLGIPLVLVLLVFYGTLLLLLRQWKRGIMPETSLVWTLVRRYRERTSFECRLQRRRRGSILLALAALTAGGLSAMVCADYEGEVGVIAGMSIAALFFLFWRTGIRSRLLEDTGRLVMQIECMAEGRDLPEEAALRRKSLLYEPSVQLKNIESAMRRSVEKQVQAERLKIDLITNVSHDLKTPLTSMVGYTDLLKKEELSAEARDYVEIISAKQEQLKNMIQDLFDLSKSTSGADQMTIEILDMRRLLEQTLGDMEDVIQASAREIRTSFAEGPLLFSGDNNKMYRVVQNLLGNALKYSMDGTRIYLEAQCRDGRVEMQIKNIASYEMDFSPDEITERFVRGDKARTTEGHGLGLAIASSFVRNMGGVLTVSIDGDLFKVTVSFPGAADAGRAEE